MASLKSQYQHLLRNKSRLLSYVSRVEVLVKSRYYKTCFRACDCSYHCLRDDRCLFGDATLKHLFELKAEFNRRLSWIQEDLDLLKQRMLIRYNAKRIAKLNKKARKNNPFGAWIHIFNQNVSNWSNYINDFSKIRGEVCVSKETDYQFAYRNQFIGVKLEGTLTAQWNCDCWSKVIANGKRWGTKNGGNHRNEGWIIPANCKITAIVCSKPNKMVTRIARELNLDIEILDQKKRNDW